MHWICSSVQKSTEANRTQAIAVSAHEHLSGGQDYGSQTEVSKWNFNRSPFIVCFHSVLNQNKRKSCGSVHAFKFYLNILYLLNTLKQTIFKKNSCMNWGKMGMMWIGYSFLWWIPLQEYTMEIPFHSACDQVRNCGLGPHADQTAEMVCI